MMKKMMKTACALAVLAASANVMAESVEVKLIGTISPASCTPTLSGTGNVDYGSILSDSLNPTGYTKLADKETQLSIVCDAPAKVAIQAVSGRKDSTVSDGTEGTSGAAAPVSAVSMPAGFGVVGLGISNGKKVGAYGVAISDVTLNSIAAKAIQSDDKQSWNDSNASSLYKADGSTSYLSWSDAGEVTPAAFETMNARLTVKTYLNKTSDLDLSKPVQLDGLTTIELVYL
ncbi:DUF1120 domain-containing protein [Pantoea dispersa]|uniref:DUF1120 domain-containing protein n=1 Tax=Pantoea dispersa TaxID=59814 RepID=UPI001BAA3FEE|nr:DUF1120 domain-containing protein [Pantoea dispersa]MBS0906154.1 DUF1120 domain-containing protein [Pantoea dispersa]